MKPLTPKFNHSTNVKFGLDHLFTSLTLDEHRQVNEHLKTLFLKRFYYKLFKSILGFVLLFLFALGFALSSAAQDTTIVDDGQSWKYDDSDNCLDGTDWYCLSYNDASWSSGNGDLGFGAPTRNTVVADLDQWTTYFRKTFTINNPHRYDKLYLEVMRDDGAVIYLNGQEIWRTNMPSGTIECDTRASGTVGGGDESAYYSTTLDLGEFILLAGNNTLAVELHQRSKTSSDIGFDLRLKADENSWSEPNTYLVDFGDYWYYNDMGLNLGTSWRNSGYDLMCEGFLYGAAELGFGDGDEETEISDVNQITNYFVKKFTTTEIDTDDSLKISMYVDDGAVVYLNGNEIWRDDIMPGGTIYYNTTATTYTPGDGNTLLTNTVLATDILSGENILAVEVHQNSSGSSDVTFNLQLEHIPVECTVSPVDKNVTWKYNDSGSNLGTGWTATAYNDLSWASGDAFLGFGNCNEETTLTDHGGETYYFRKVYNITDVSDVDYLMMDLVLDDGAVVYVNGNEINRYNMPSGAITYTTTASNSNDTLESELYSLQIPAAYLVTGTNVVAVEVHQFNGSDGDLTFHADFTEVTKPSGDVVVDFDSDWNYKDDDEDLGTSWRDLSYKEDLTWKTGESELGFNEGDENTVLTNHGRYTYYFRHYFNETGMTTSDSLKFSMNYDDGAVVYLNGTQVWSANMPESYDHDTRASSVESSDGHTIYTKTVLASMIQSGTNVIAVEIHQQSSSSSDISFNMQVERILVDSCAIKTDYNVEWKYSDIGTYPGGTWTDPSFNDAAWSTGDGLFGFGHCNEETELNDHGGSTYYFRKNYTISDVSTVDYLMMDLVLDDGAVIYVNGTEINRYNLPSGTIAHSTNASTEISGSSEIQLHQLVIPRTALVTGSNTFAVEVHQHSNSDGDMKFHADFTEVSKSAGDTLISFGTDWNYRDDGEDLGASWKSRSYKENLLWKSGKAQLGFGDDDEETVVDNHGGITYYFRHYFHVDAFNRYDTLLVNLIRDDGAVVYINGIELLRSNIAAVGTVTNNTTATHVEGSEENQIFNYTAFARDLVDGVNVIAVEIHQDNTLSSDISFDLEMTLKEGTEFFIFDYDSIGGTVFLDVDISKSLTPGDAGAGAIEVLTYQDVNGDLAIDDGDPLLFSFLTNPDGGYKMPVYPKEIQSIKSNVSQSSDDAFQESGAKTMDLVSTVLHSVKPTATIDYIDTLDTWSYYDNGDIGDSTWMDDSYDDSGWSTGAGQLGFGDPSIETNLSSGKSTYYFRKKFEADWKILFASSATLRLIRDDGAVVYVNGKEVYRSNMNEGKVTYSTLAKENVSGANEDLYREASIGTEHFISGENIIAVEIHQDQVSSSDLHFDLSLTANFGNNDEVGLRFQNIDVPKGAEIVDAFLRLTPSETTTDLSKITITSQSANNAATFTSGVDNIGSRARNSTVSYWTPTTVLEKDKTVRVDLNPKMIQEVVDRIGWVSGNAMAFFLKDSPLKYYSINANNDMEPELIISYLDEEATSIRYIVTIDEGDLPEQHNFMTDKEQIIDFPSGERSTQSSTNFGYIGSTSICYASGDDDFKGSYIINRFSGKNKFLGYSGASYIEAIDMDKGGDTLYGIDQNIFGIIDLTSGAFMPYDDSISMVRANGIYNGSPYATYLNDIDGLAYDIERGHFWATVRRNGDFDLIIKIDKSTGQFIPDAFGPGVDYVQLSGADMLADLDDIAIDPLTGRLCAMNNNNGGKTNLVLIDEETGAGVKVGDTGLDDLEGQGFHNDGQFYTTSGNVGTPKNSFYEVNKTTAEMTYIGSFDGGGDFEGCGCLGGPVINFVDGYVFEDTDEDGIYTKGIDDPVSGVKIYLYRDIDGSGTFSRRASVDMKYDSTTTDTDGYFAMGTDLLDSLVITPAYATMPPEAALMTTDSLQGGLFRVNGSVDLFNNFGFRSGPVLPIELVDFYGYTVADENHLFWNTSAEVNNEKFEIERSSNGISFNKIGDVAGQGTSTSNNAYTFIDADPLDGVNYYRLKQKDFNGKFEYSEVIGLTNNNHRGIEGSEVNIYSNPVKNTLSIDFSTKQFVNRFVDLALYSMSGERVIIHKIDTQDANFFSYDIGSLPNGIYLLEIRDKREIISEKITKF